MLDKPSSPNRSLLVSAESACVSLALHLAALGLALALTQGGPRLPADEREARVFFLLPPDRVPASTHQSDVMQWGRLGGDLADGTNLLRSGAGRRIRADDHGSRLWGKRSGARPALPFGPAERLVADSVFSVLEVDRMVERFDGSAAPAYPPDLIQKGVEGMVQAIYVVDTTGRVDTASVEVVLSDDPKFTQSVREALDHMRFRPALRGGRPVRQRVQQKFRFEIQPPPELARPASAHS
ncbi:MAG TPA: energy transducer TonB [Gemmatimonadales bacterium]|nr:energy transducer TonB [Gemmatimonadales bacterium]